MRQLIKGDIARILRKKEIYIFAFLLYVILFAVKSKTEVEDQIDSILKSTVSNWKLFIFDDG